MIDGLEGESRIILKATLAPVVGSAVVVVDWSSSAALARRAVTPTAAQQLDAMSLRVVDARQRYLAAIGACATRLDCVEASIGILSSSLATQIATLRHIDFSSPDARHDALALVALLRPPWRRAIFGQPHLGFELVATDAGLTIGWWVPGTVPPGLVERAVEAAWPGARTETIPAAPPLTGDGVATGGELRLALPEQYPLRTAHKVDPLRPLLGALDAMAEDESACVQILARPVTGRRLTRLHKAAAARRAGRPARSTPPSSAGHGGPGRPRRKPWASGTPRSTRTSSSASRSTPSARIQLSMRSAKLPSISSRARFASSWSMPSTKWRSNFTNEGRSARRCWRPA